MNDLAALLTATGAGSAVTALLAGLFGWRLRSANYAQIAAEMTRQVAADLRDDNAKLEAKVDSMQLSIDSLRDRIGVLTDTLRMSISVHEQRGDDTAAMRAVLYGRTNGHPL